jgi:hypothetical protein
VASEGAQGEEILRENGSSLLIWLEENDLHGSGLVEVARVNADGQAALGQRGLKGARAHEEERRLGRHAIHFPGRVRLGQKFHHFNFGSHTLVVILSAVSVPWQARANG